MGIGRMEAHRVGAPVGVEANAPRGRADRVDDQRYLINGRIFSMHDPALQDALARTYGTPTRPQCLCIDGGVEMYVSKFDEFVIKRMPESGGQHHPTCPSYQLPARDSGLGQVLGEAIIEHGPDLVELRLDFPLSRRIGRSHAVEAMQSPAEVRVARKQLSLCGLLHYLWERAGFNRWYPWMQGKRSYAVVRKFLLQACEEIETKGLRLSERVFIPEPFMSERAAEITIQHRKALAVLSSPEPRRHFKMMIAIGELKEFKATTVGHRLAFKHLPDCALFLERRAGERTKAIFERELLAWSNGQVKLVAACLIHAKQDRCYEVESLTLMMVSPQWIPLDHACERDVVDKLVAEERAFIKPLRYEAPDAGKFPNFQLLDTGARPVPLDIVSAFLSEAEHAAKVHAIGVRDPKGWLWDTAQDAVIPALPPKARLRANDDASLSNASPNAVTNA
jgi:hypothetical protein